MNIIHKSTWSFELCLVFVTEKAIKSGTKSMKTEEWKESRGKHFFSQTQLPNDIVSKEKVSLSESCESWSLTRTLVKGIPEMVKGSKKMIEKNWNWAESNLPPNDTGNEMEEVAII